MGIVHYYKLKDCKSSAIFEINDLNKSIKLINTEPGVVSYSDIFYVGQKIKYDDFENMFTEFKSNNYSDTVEYEDTFRKLNKIEMALYNL